MEPHSVPDALFEDIHAAASLLKVPARTGLLNTLRVRALERGNRVRPDGTRESYERVEFNGG